MNAVLERPRASSTATRQAPAPAAINIAAVTAWLVEQRAAANKRRAAFPLDVREFAPTPAQLEARDFQSLVAGGWVLL